MASIAYRVWIESPAVNDRRVELQRQAEQKAAIADQTHLTAKRMTVPKLDWTLRQFEEFENSGKAQQERDGLNEVGPKEKAWLGSAEVLRLEWDSPPDYIDVPVPGESTFLVARKVCQATLYMYLITHSVKEVIFMVKVATWCRKRFLSELILIYWTSILSF